MTNVIERRRRNLQHLIAEFGDIEKLASRVKVNATWLAQIERGEAEMGEETARQLETRTGRPPGWMDVQLRVMPSYVRHSYESLPPERRDTIDELIMMLRIGPPVA